MRQASLLLILTMGLVAAAGCTRTIYLEQETAPGSVPTGSVPTASVARPTAPPAPQAPKRPAPAVGVVRPAEQVVESGGVALPPEKAVEIRRRFAEAYAAKDSPRMAVYLNRGLSDEVRQWVIANWRISSGESSHALDIVQTGAATAVRERDAATEAGRSANAVHAGLGGADIPVTDRWIWTFEDGFRGPFESVGKVIDRALIMRNVAAASGLQGEVTAPISVKQTEMEALGKYADILIEVRMARDDIGAVARAEAKEVATGVSLGRVTTATWGDLNRTVTSTRTVATESGYRDVVETVSVPPTLEDIAKRLALELMDKLAAKWE